MDCLHVSLTNIYYDVIHIEQMTDLVVLVFWGEEFCVYFSSR
jgi:hypothetical protein